MKFKIVISQITETEVQETVDCYVNKKTNEKLEWYSWHNLDKKEKKNFEEQKVLTGETKINRKEKDIYEQEFEHLDVGEIALFLNRAR